MQKSRYDIIDLLRGISILLVVIRHVQIRIPFQNVPIFQWMSDHLVSAVFMSGHAGVRIFFVISGFLITLTSLNRWGNLQDIDFKKFYKYRFARIAPCLLGLLAILSSLHFLGVKDYIISSKFTYFEALFSALTFHLNWLEGMKGYLPGNWDVLWSLSVEEVFYFFFPILCLLTRNKYFLSLVLLSLIVYGPFYRSGLEGQDIWQTKAYLSCMDSIAIGCLMAIWTHKKEISSWLLKSFNVLGVVLIILVLFFKYDLSLTALKDMYVYPTIISVGTGLVLISSVRQKLALRSFLYPIVWYGRLSYEVYLTHMFIVYSGIRLYKYYGSPLAYAPIWLLGIIIISGLLGFVIEKYFSVPLNNKIRKYNFKYTKN